MPQSSHDSSVSPLNFPHFSFYLTLILFPHTPMHSFPYSHTIAPSLRPHYRAFSFLPPQIPMRLPFQRVSSPPHTLGCPACLAIVRNDSSLFYMFAVCEFCSSTLGSWQRFFLSEFSLLLVLSLFTQFCYLSYIYDYILFLHHLYHLYHLIPMLP